MFFYRPLRKIRTTYFSKVVFFIVHPLRKIWTANLLFVQNRAFYRASVALGCAGLVYAAMGWGGLLRLAPGWGAPGCFKPLWVALGGSGLLCGLLWERPGKNEVSAKINFWAQKFIRKTYQAETCNYLRSGVPSWGPPHPGSKNWFLSAAVNRKTVESGAL